VTGSQPDRALAAASTVAAMFGMTRMTGLFWPRRSRMKVLSTPAMIEMMSWSGRTAGRMWSRTPTRVWGFTARMMIFAFAAGPTASLVA